MTDQTPCPSTSISTTAGFEASLERPSPPEGLPSALEALWHAGHGDWPRAHELVQDGSTREDAWVHAYLHREEGDLGNAAYWYARAGKAIERGDLRLEWRAIVTELLRAGSP